jgi:hypothetical protein
MRFLFHQDRLESALKQVADPFVPAVKTLSIDPVELAHTDGEIGFGRLDQQMIMIPHQAVGVGRSTRNDRPRQRGCEKCF